MKFSICQINPSVGDLDYNYKKIIDFYNKSLVLGSDIVIFPELSITGYPPKDLLFEKNFIEKNLDYCWKISKLSTKPIIFGYVNRINDNLYNSAAVCYSGKLCYSYNKKLLPNYDIFDEKRYFRSGFDSGVFQIQYDKLKISLGLQICEDIWDEPYSTKISEDQKKKGAEVIINISASPFCIDKLTKRTELIKNKAKTLSIPFIYCNMVGAQDEIIFDGSSLAYSQDGKLIQQGKYFDECVTIVDFEKNNSIKLKIQKREEKIFNALCLGVSDYFYKTGNSESVLGLSGGIDSALTAAIACEALGSKNVHGILMPSKFSSEHSIKDAKLLAENLGMDYRNISIQNSVDTMLKSLKNEFLGLKEDTTEENIQSRIRGSILMALSNKFNWILLTTGNKTELALGYCTIYGDMNGGLGVISDLNKLDVYKLAKWYNKNKNKKIPQNSINKSPSAELSYNQIDPFDYNIISPLVDNIIENKKLIKDLVSDNLDIEFIQKIYQKINNNEFKRYQSAPGLKISNKAFGIGRRFPIVNNYKG